MISLTKFVLAIFVICFAAAFPFDDESPWEGLFNYEDEGNTKDKCCGRNYFIFTEDLPDSSKCLRKLRVVSDDDLPRKFSVHLNRTTLYLGSELVLHRGILYESMCPPSKCLIMKKH